VRARLFPGKKEQIIAEGITNDTFALVVRQRDSSFDINRVWKILEESGADRVREREAEL